jgi:hypothetical protein
MSYVICHMSYVICHISYVIMLETTLLPTLTSGMYVVWVYMFICCMSYVVCHTSNPSALCHTILYTSIPLYLSHTPHLPYSHTPSLPLLHHLPYSNLPLLHHLPYSNLHTYIYPLIHTHTLLSDPYETSSHGGGDQGVVDQLTDFTNFHGNMVVNEVKHIICLLYVPIIFSNVLFYFLNFLNFLIFNFILF